MVNMTMELPDKLAERIQPIRPWLPIILELSFANLKTPAAETSVEIIQFLSTNPSPKEVCNYHVSERAQKRLQYLLGLNSTGLLGEIAQHELDDMEKIEHIMIMYKARISKQLQQGVEKV
jgi:hypothetical protein